MAGVLQIDGSPVNHRLGSISIQWGEDAPYQLSAVYKVTDPADVPAAGVPVEWFNNLGTRKWRGMIDDVNIKGLFESSSTIEVEIHAIGRNVKLFERVCFNTSTSAVPVFRSYASVVSTATTTVTWESGDLFDKDLEGATITVDGNSRTVVSVTSPKSLTVNSSLGTLTSVNLVRNYYSGAAIKHLLDNYADNEGFTYGVGDIADGVALKEEIPYNQTVWDAIQRIKQLNPTFALWIDESGDNSAVYFKERSGVAAPVVFTDASGKYRRSLSKSESRLDVRNTEISRVKWETLVSTKKSITGDSSTRQWFVDTNIGELVAIRLNNVPMSAGAEGSSNNDIYYKPNGRAVWLDAATPVPTATDTIEVEYYPLGADLIGYSDETAIAARALVETGTSGQIQVPVDRTESIGQVEANTDAQINVERFKNNLEKFQLVTWEEGIYPGQLVTVLSSKLGIDTTYYVESVSATDAGVEGTEYDLLYTLQCSSAIRRTAESILRALFNPGSGSGSSVTAPSGSNDTPSSVTLGTITFDRDTSRYAIPITMPLSGLKPTQLHILAECPSMADVQVLSGDIVGDGSKPVDSGQKPLDLGYYNVDETTTTITAALDPSPEVEMTSRVIVISATATSEQSFDSAPKQEVVIGPAEGKKDGSGVEFAPLVTNLTGKMTVEQIGTNWFWWFQLWWTEPTGNIYWENYNGVQIDLFDPSIDSSVSNQYGPIATLEKGKTSFTLAGMMRVPDEVPAYRVYVRSRGKIGINTIVPAVTPYVEFIPTPTIDSLGVEYSDLITGLAWSATPYWEKDPATGQPRFVMPFQLVHPNSDPRYGWGYLSLIRSGGRKPLEQNINRTQTSGVFYLTDRDGFSESTETLTLVAYSVDKEGRANSYKSGTTPEITVSVDPPATGSPLAHVTGFSVAAAYSDPDNNGKRTLKLTPTFTIPDDNSWAYIEFWAYRPDATAWYLLGYPSVGGAVDVATVEQLPSASGSWTFKAISKDVNGRDRDGNTNSNPASPPSGTPSVSVTIAPPLLGSSGEEYAPLVTSPTCVLTYGINGDGVEVWGFSVGWANPSDTRYAGIKLVARNTGTGADTTLGYTGPADVVLRTDQWPIVSGVTYDVYFVSIDVNGRENSLVPGTTPRVQGLSPALQTGGSLKPSRLSATNLPDEWVIDGADLKVQYAVVEKLWGAKARFGGTAAVTIESASNADPLVITKTGHGLTGDVALNFAGGTGNWAALNGPALGRVVDADHIAVPLYDSTTWGAVTGTITYAVARPGLIELMNALGALVGQLGKCEDPENPGSYYYGLDLTDGSVVIRNTTNRRKIVCTEGKVYVYDMDDALNTYTLIDANGIEVHFQRDSGGGVMVDCAVNIAPDAGGDGAVIQVVDDGVVVTQIDRNAVNAPALKQGGTALGDAAFKDTGTEAGTVAAGDDSRFVTNGDSHDHSGGDGAQISFSTLDGVPTLPRIDGAVNLTGQTGSLGPTSILTPVSDGMYRASVYVICTTSGSAGNVSTSIGFLDENSNSSSVSTNALPLTVQTFLEKTICFYAKAGTAITYTTTVTGASGSPQYALRVRVERIED